MQESRLFQILYYLLNKGEATASELAEKFEVSVRTIYRDIDKLSCAGIPVYTVTGYKGGIRLDESFVLKKSVLSQEDMQNILMGVQSLSAICFPSADAVSSKLQALFQMQNADWVEVDYSRWGCDAEKEKRTFGLLQKAIQEKREICFKYYNSRGEVSDRKCLPVKLIFKGRAWYLHAYCFNRNAMRVFRISRMKELHVTDQLFQGISKENALFPPQADGKMIEIELSFNKKAAHRIYDIFDESMITETEDGFIVKTAVPEDEWLFGFLMSFGDGLTILKPAYLKEELKKRFISALKHLES